MIIISLLLLFYGRYRNIYNNIFLYHNNNNVIHSHTKYIIIIIYICPRRQSVKDLIIIRLVYNIIYYIVTIIHFYTLCGLQKVSMIRCRYFIHNRRSFFSSFFVPILNLYDFQLFRIVPVRIYYRYFFNRFYRTRFRALLSLIE